MQTAMRMQREEKILLSLDKLTYATREQLQIINDLKGDRNAHRILHRMEKDKTLKSIRKDRKIYYLSNKGKEQIGSNQSDLKKDMIQHTLMRNDLYIKLGMPNDWKVEVPLKIDGEVILICDAMFSKNGEYHFVEIDNTQSMRTNFDKIKKYKKMSRVIFNNFNHHPTLIWYTHSNIRKEKLKNACEKSALKFIVY